jgi:HlyD family secretion protein
VKRKWWFIGGGTVLFAVALVMILKTDRTKVREVEMEEAALRDLVETVTASGTIHPKRSVDVSANVIGKITRLAVAEGDQVREGDFLLEIDPTEFRANVRSLEAGVRTAQADLDLAVASAEKAELDLRRAEALNREGLHSEEQLEAARTNAQVEQARVAAARSRLVQQQAELERAHYNLDKVTVTAPMSGIITRLNVEEGENAIMGTLNNPGTVLLVIADLSAMEARVKVDETEVVKVALDQKAKIKIDAFPDTTFAAHVTEIGNSPIYAATGASEQAVDFEVKITLDERIVNIRPGLSAKADIDVARREQAVSVPLGSVTVRKWPLEEKAQAHGRRGRRDRQEKPEDAAAGQAKTSTTTESAAAASDTAAAAAQPARIERKEKEGVFVVEGGIAHFRPVELGIAGEDHFEIVRGLEKGQTVVTGPFRILRDLKDGDAVKAKKKSGRGGDEDE